MAKKVAIVLSGCGSRDGSEVHESVLTLLGVVKNGAEPLFFAPAGPQARVVNHITGEVEAGAERSMIIEAARIARGKIRDLRELTASMADCLVFPGGFGTAYNLFTFAEQGANCSVNSEVERVINEFYQAKKPIGFICIAPALGAKVLGRYGVEVTLGNDEKTAATVKSMGARHVIKRVDEIHVDEKNKVLSTPAYMLAQNIGEAEAGISKLVEAIVRMS